MDVIVEQTCDANEHVFHMDLIFEVGLVYGRLGMLILLDETPHYMFFMSDGQ